MPVPLHHIVVDAHDLPGLALFWTQALGWKILSEREREIVIGLTRARSSACASCRSPIRRGSRTACTPTWPAARRTRTGDWAACRAGGAPGRHRTDRRRVLDYAGRPRGKRVLRGTPEGNVDPV